MPRMHHLQSRLFVFLKLAQASPWYSILAIYLLIFLCILQTEGLTLISESDWQLFCEEWNALKDKGILAEIFFGNNCTSKANGSSEHMPMLVEEVDHCNGESNNELEARSPLIRTYPEVKLPSVWLYSTR